MIFSKTDIAGVYVVDLDRREDDRGYFARAWCEKEFADRGLSARIAQVNVAVSSHAGTLRGMHYQRAPHAEAKLVRCTRGRVFDVAVDLRPLSLTFRRWFGVELDARAGRALYVPEGCAHGYLTLGDDTELMYISSAPYAPEAASGIRFDDAVFGIEWPAAPVVVSRQDRQWPAFNVAPKD